MNELSPEWRSAWQLNDPAWVADRKRKWKGVKSSPAIERLFMPNRDELKKIKNFYLTGSAYDPEPPEDKWWWFNYHPDNQPIPACESMLIELWLTADDSEDNFHCILRKYGESDHRDARNKFRDALHRLYPEYGDIFDGRGLRIYQLLGPTRCRVDDYPDVSNERYYAICDSVYVNLVTTIRACLNGFPGLEIALEIVREWCDAVTGAYYHKQSMSKERGDDRIVLAVVSGVGKTVSLCCEIATQRNGFSETQILLAERLIEFLSATDLPSPIEQVVGCIRDVGKI